MPPHMVDLVRSGDLRRRFETTPTPNDYLPGIATTLTVAAQPAFAGAAARPNRRPPDTPSMEHA